MSWDDVGKFLLMLLSLFAGVFGLARYIMNKDQEKENLKAQHQKDIEAIKEKNSEKFLTQLTADLKLVTEKYHQMEKTMLATIQKMEFNDAQRTETLREIRAMRAHFEKKILQLESVQVDLGNDFKMLKTKTKEKQ